MEPESTPKIDESNKPKRGRRRDRRTRRKKVESGKNGKCGLKIPQWFLENCVKTAEEISVLKIPLIVREDVFVGSATTPEVDSPASDMYEIAAAVYEPLREIVNDVSHRRKTKPKACKFFTNDAVHLRFPDKGQTAGGDEFLTVVVEHLAQAIGADLITLRSEDLIDLAEHYTESTVKPISNGRHDGSSDELEDESSKDTQAPYPARSTFSCHLLPSPDIKRRANSDQDSPRHRNPLIILLPRVRQLLDVDQWDFTKGLRDANTHTIIISTEDRDRKPLPSPCACCPSDSVILGKIGKNPRSDAVRLAPIGTKAQQALFDTRREFEMSFESKNVRILQRAIRQISQNHKSLSILQPFAKWKFLENTQIQRKLAKEQLNGEEKERIIQSVSRSPKNDSIMQAVLRLGDRTEALDGWCNLVQNKSRHSRWSSLPDATQNTIRRVEDGGKTFTWEQRFLDLLVIPNEVEERWSDIVLEPEVRDSIIRLISQPFRVGASALGILKNSRISGALLYGPPGTGKTQLARVLARESKAIMICVTAAEIQSKWVGESQKAIKGLFNLGKMLFPCIIFFDEADSLFGRRTSEDRRWERAQTNQLLQEMDGLKTVRTSPFVILATNFPRHLDHAVLRRVPSRIYLGLPTIDERIRIFQLHLKDEILDTDVDFGLLGRKSWRYSGSDIKNVCLMAALICNTFIDDEVPRRIIKWKHFTTAFQRSPATTSEASLIGIMAFAREFDHAALDKMVQEKKLGHSASEEQARIADPGAPSVPTYQNPAQTPAPEKIPSARFLDGVGLKKAHTKTSGGNDCDTGTSMEGDLELPYQYTPLQPDSNQIRLLSFEPPVSSNIADNALLRCSLKKVDLDDWTRCYRAWLPICMERLIRIFEVPNTDKARSAAWRRTSTTFSLDHERWEEAARAFVQERKSRSWTNDAPFEETENVLPRYEWGDFIALSYVWGDPGKRHDIRLDGHRFSVTHNLYQALLSLRDSVEIRRMGLHVWIDAICINQDDYDERGAQVKKMNVIYSQALMVRGFLGQTDAQIAVDLQALRTVLDTTSICEIPQHLTVNNLDWDTIRNMGLEYSFWRGIIAISSSPYWKRVWTIQETILAPSLLYYYGQQAFSQLELFKSLNLISDTITSSRTGTLRFVEIRCLMDSDSLNDLFASFTRLHFSISFQPLYNATSEEHEMRLAELAMVIRGSEATDLRDKVFGVLAMLPKEIAARNHPNYHPLVSFSDAFRSFSKSCFQVLGNLNFLSSMCRAAPFVEGLPTWVLSLSGNITRSIGPQSFNRLDSGANLGMHKTEIAFLENDTLLLCHGVVVDTTSLLGAAHFGPLSSPLQFCSDMQQNLPDPARFTPEEWKLKLARTLIQNRCLHFKESPSIFDIPWLERDELENHKAQYYDDLHSDALDISDEADSYWPKSFAMSQIGAFFKDFMYGNEEVSIGGQPLKSYFTSTEETHFHPEVFREMGSQLIGLNLNMRLCISRTGLLCVVPITTQLNDKIVVLSECNAPMILRPRGENYQVIGPCFVESLMNGEVAEGIERGQYHVERIHLC